MDQNLTSKRGSNLNLTIQSRKGPYGREEFSFYYADGQRAIVNGVINFHSVDDAKRSFKTETGYDFNG